MKPEEIQKALESGDLNEMRKVEAALGSQEVKERYAGWLGLIVEAEESKHECWEMAATTPLMLFCFCHASAAQRREAYLRATGQLKDDAP